MLPADQMAKTQQRLDGFKAGHGTILFFDDETVIRQQQEAFKLYADNFPIWANQTNVSAFALKVLPCQY
jgi:predicted oxidoreductase (fatty acid repression mutant protein)